MGEEKKTTSRGLKPFGTSYRQIAKDPDRYLPAIKTLLDAESSGVVLFPVGHLDFKRAERMADRLELACDRAGGLIEVVRLKDPTGQPCILMKYREGLEHEN